MLMNTLRLSAARRINLGLYSSLRLRSKLHGLSGIALGSTAFNFTADGACPGTVTVNQTMGAFA